MSAYNRNSCLVPTVWCGSGTRPKKNVNPGNYNVYTRNGTTYECLQKGIGAGIYIERQKTLPKDSLQHIKYVGDVDEKKFKTSKIRTTGELVRFANSNGSNSLDGLLRKVLKKKSGVFDKRAYNSVLMYLDDNKTPHGLLPGCVRI